MPPRKTKMFSDQIRNAIHDSELSRYAICKAIGLDQASMSRFMAGDAGMSMEKLDRLFQLLNLEVAYKHSDDRKGK